MKKLTGKKNTTEQTDNTKDEIIRKKKHHKSRNINYTSDEEICVAFIEICIFICFLCVTTIVALSVRHLHMFYFNKTLEKVFLQRDFQNPHIASGFDYLVTTNDWWTFMEVDFLNRFHGSGDIRLEKDKHMLMNENLLLGPPRLRQIRVRKDTCEVHPAFDRYFDACYAEYDRSVEDRSAFHKGTVYQDNGDVSSRPIWGRMGCFYRGGGYMKNLTYDPEDNRKILAALKKDDWIDRGTRLVVIEFGVYNVNTDLFENVKFLAEVLPIGGILTSWRMYAMQLCSFWTSGNYWIIGAAAIFYIMIIYYTVEEIREFWDFGFANYFTSLWNYVDLIILACGYIAFVYNIWHSVYLKSMLKRIKANPDNYESLDDISLWNMIYVDLMALCAFCVWLKIFKYISFNKTLMQFSTTLKRCTKDLCGFGLMFLIVFLAYALLGLLLFGDQHKDFRNFYQAFLTMMRMVLGDFDYLELERANRLLGPIYFISYTLLVFFILLNMFLAIINSTYTQVKKEIQKGHNYLQDFLSRKFRNFGKWLRTQCKCCVKTSRKKDQDKLSVGSAVQVEPSPSVALESGGVQPAPSGLFRTPQNIIRGFFEDVGPGPSIDAADVTRLAQRILLVENLLESLVRQMDRITNRIDTKQRKRQKPGDDPKERAGPQAPDTSRPQR